jgi:glyoxylase-like metal-dependent hydrolase (beta-lactamase superfamily II)
MKIAKGLHRIGSDTVNSYLVVDGGGVTIIDAGLSRYWKLLSNELTRLGMTLDDVRALILTHGDTDHIGFAARLHREKNIAAYLHPADAARARLEVKKPNSGWGPVKAGPLAGVAVHVPAVDALFIGDTMTTRNVLTGATGPKPAPFTLEPEQALASLGRIHEVDATWVLPGHGPAWDGGVAEAVQLTREAGAR